MKRLLSFVSWSALVLSLVLFSAGYFALVVVKVPQTPGIIYAMFTAHWLATVSVCAVAFVSSFSITPRRFWISILLSLLATASSWWGLACIRISSTQTVNGRSQCLFDSRWFFTASLVLAILTLCFTLWQKWRIRQSSPIPAPQPP